MRPSGPAAKAQPMGCYHGFANGVLPWVSLCIFVVSSWPAFEESGPLVGSLGMNVDETERKKNRWEKESNR